MRTTRHIRSFVLRAGRMTPAQSRAWNDHWPRFGLEFSGALLDLDASFGRCARRVLEIGFGNGDVIAALAEQNPAIDYLGIEVHRPGVGRLLHRCAGAPLANVRIVCHDAVEVLTHGAAESSFDEVMIFFPDPWHKKRHHKRRLIDAAFMELLVSRLRPQGIVRIATDWEHYAMSIASSGASCTHLVTLGDARGLVERFTGRSPTRFEMRGERLGHRVWDFAFRKESCPESHRR